MKRQEFIHLFGFGAAMVLSGCLGSCASKTEDPKPAPGPGPGPTVIDFTVDLNDPAIAGRVNNPALGYVYGANGQVIVAKTVAGTYVALAAACTHQGTTVVFQTSSDGFYCPGHGSSFTNGGAVVIGPAAIALRKYTVTQTGMLLRITA